MKKEKRQGKEGEAERARSVENRERSGGRLRTGDEVGRTYNHVIRVSANVWEKESYGKRENRMKEVEDWARGG